MSDNQLYQDPRIKKKISKLLNKLKWKCEKQVKNMVQGVKEMRQEEL